MLWELLVFVNFVALVAVKCYYQDTDWALFMVEVFAGLSIFALFSVFRKLSPVHDPIVSVY